MIFIREMVADDIYRGYLDVVASLSDSGLRLPEAIEVWKQIQESGNIMVFVAVEDGGGKCVGTTTVIVERKFIHHGGIVGHIEDVAVHTNFRGQQIASRLLSHTIKYCKSLGCYKVILDCPADLVRFYTKFGFKPHETGMRLSLK